MASKARGGTQNGGARQRVSDTVLLFPEHRPGKGIGHLVRTFRIAATDTSRFRIYLPLGTDEALRTLLERIGYSHLIDLCVREVESVRDPSLYVVDIPWAGREELASLRNRPILGLDVGGEARQFCCFVVDSLPRVKERNRANRIVSPLVQWIDSGSKEDRGERVLVSFGGDDPAGLTLPTVRTLIERCGIRPDQLYVAPILRGDDDGALPESVTVLRRGSNFRKELCSYETVITSFGLTAFEALAAGCRVLVVDPTRYHASLSKAASLPQCGVKRVNARKLRRILRGDWRETTEARNSKWSSAWSLLRAPTPPELLSQLDPRGRRACPACNTDMNRAVARFEERTYKRCRQCGLLYVVRLTPPQITYTERYFFEEYRAQYGRSYIEDFPHIKKMARRRLQKIGPSNGGRATLLDVGCAYGAFLDAAREMGYRCFGIDVSEEAIAYLRSHLSLDGAVTGIEEFSAYEQFGVEAFDCVTMWYVMEHLVELDRALRKVAGLLRIGGVFAFATPNGEGISARANRMKFLRESPADHYTVWEPSRAGTILRRYGFRIRSIAITGHHPERFPKPLDRPELRRIAHWGSRALGLGDTFEVYAVKEEEAS